MHFLAKANIEHRLVYLTQTDDEGLRLLQDEFAGLPPSELDSHLAQAS
jgi:hypothetical protein